MFAVVVRFNIKPERWGAFMPLMQQNANASVSLEPMCKQFDVLTDPSKPHEVLLYEIYDSQKHLMNISKARTSLHLIGKFLI